ncbi:MAG: acylneuraminate cytidylyltransferase family protein [Ignavibacteriaceae bacterium]|nr:acylneuraminate cytidylyltransferase family protein [Ignavibacteriaceae bacterium]
MIKENILGIIPARGGSKGVPRKNIKLLGGKPLIAYTIENGLQSKYIDKLIVSTDDEEIADISTKHGALVPFLRPKELANDTAKAIGVVKHALITMEEKDGVEYSIVVYLEPPAPLKLTEDIDTAIEMFIEKKPDSVVSVNEANQFHPILMKQIVNGKLEPIWKPEPEGVPRQQYEPKAYMRNGAVYVLKRSNILDGKFYGSNILPYIMPLERSICIDDMNDWYVAEAWMRNKERI